MTLEEILGKIEQIGEVLIKVRSFEEVMSIITVLEQFEDKFGDNGQPEEYHRDYYEASISENCTHLSVHTDAHLLTGVNYHLRKAPEEQEDVLEISLESFLEGHVTDINKIVNNLEVLLKDK